VILEDELQRVPLELDGLNDNALCLNNIMTGCIVAVKGVPQDGGKFSVTDYCWPTPSPTSKTLTNYSSRDDRYNFFFCSIKLNSFN